jgi:XTP/dITP diphosphohydrolase
MKVVIATHNKDKLKELKRGLANLNIDLLDLSFFPEIGEIIEDGNTLKANALIKAKHVYQITGLPAIADDTGLEVDFLEGKPGVLTARFAGENCSYMDNVNKMLKVLKNVQNSHRGAIFKTVMVFYDGKRELFSEGIVKGIIAKKKKGLAGFGYDPIFYVVEEGKTFAEMTIEKKNIISHRGRAIKNLMPELTSYLNNPNTTKEFA